MRYSKVLCHTFQENYVMVYVLLRLVTERLNPHIRMTKTKVICFSCDTKDNLVMSVGSAALIKISHDFPEYLRLRNYYRLPVSTAVLRQPRVIIMTRFLSPKIVCSSAWSGWCQIYVTDLHYRSLWGIFIVDMWFPSRGTCGSPQTTSNTKNVFVVQRLHV